MHKILVLFRIALTLLIVFGIQKILFIFYNINFHKDIVASDVLDVIFHGLVLDISVTGYILIIPWILIFVSFFLKSDYLQKLIFNKILPAYFVIISLITTIIFVSDTALYEFWKFKIDATIFNYIDKPKDVIASISLGYLVIYVLSIIIISIGTSLALIKQLPTNDRKTGSLWNSIWMIPIVALMFIAIRGGIGKGTASIANVYYCNNQFLNHAAVNPNFNILYSYLHTQNFSSQFRYMSEEECQTIIKESIPPKESSELLRDTLLNMDRPNIIMIIWEGCGEQLAKCIGGTEDITPGLSRIASEGILFTNCYSNSFRTDRGVTSLLSGWQGLPTASLMKMPEKYGKLPGLAKSLHYAGYSSEFWYGGDITFTNMGSFVIDNGFGKVISDKNFSIKERLSSNWGVNDEILFDKIAEDIIHDKSNQENPWFTTILTLSSHEPWDVPFHKYNDNRKDAFAFTDSAIEDFIEKIKNSEVWNKTLVCIVSDHGYIVDEESKTKDKELIHIPFVLTGGAIKAKGKTINDIMNQSDIPATILAQLGLSHDEYTFSRNILGKNYSHPFAINTSTTTFSVVDTIGITVYDFVGNQTVYDTDQATSKNRILMGKALLQNLYDKTDDL